MNPGNLESLLLCPKAWTLVGVDPDRLVPLLVAISCRTWSCPTCARTKIRKLANLTRLACPNRLLTLTTDVKLYAHPRDAFECSAPRVPELIRHLRKRFGEVEYLRVTELTKHGYPHYHLLVRSGFLPHAVVKALWSKLTGNTIVDLRAVKKTFGAYYYLLKYLSKLHKLEWTERHVSYSKSFFPTPVNPKNTRKPLNLTEKIQEHPYLYLANHFADAEIKILCPGVFELPHNEKSPPHEIRGVDFPQLQASSYSPWTPQLPVDDDF